MSRSVVVTGANSGIGLACVSQLARAGFEVIGTVRSEEKARELRAHIEASDLQIRTIVLDVADADSAKAAVAEIGSMTGGGPWGLVNNAGFAQAGAIEDVDDEQARLQLETNLLATVRLARYVLPSMRERGAGRIVNISSFGGRITEPFLGWYCASKRGLEAVSDALRIEAAPYGVAVLVVQPGGFRSNIWQRGVESLPARQFSAYGHLYGLADTMLERSKSLPGPEPVARVVYRALRDPRPRSRYLVGKDVWAGALMEALLPTAATDYVKGLTTGLHAPDDRVAAVAKRVLARFI